MIMKSVYEERPWLKHYLPGMRHDIDVPSVSLGDAFDAAVKKWDRKKAISYYGNTIKYRELAKKVNSLASALSKLGLKKGDRIAFLLLNSPEFVISFFAAAKLGIIVTPISPVYVSSEIKHQLLDSGAKSIICQDILYEGLEKTGVDLEHIILTNISESLPKLKKMMGKSILRGVYQKMSAPAPQIYEKKGLLRLQELIASNEPTSLKVPIDTNKDILTLHYTGGTTGAPKGVMINHYSVIANYYQCRESAPEIIDGKETIVNFMPYYHVGGQANMINPLLSGHNLVIITTPDVDDILNAMVIYGATYFMSAPTMYEMLKDYEKTVRVDWGKLKYINSGADSLNEYTARDWEKRTGTKITEGYGLTEATYATHMNLLEKQRYGSIGIPVPGTWAAILDIDKDKFLPVGETGELVISGPQITKGYWNNPQATKECEVILEDRRWWRTGDLARMDEDGYFYIYDRKRDLIKYKGLKVFAREVEEVLKNHPDIKEVGVVGVADEKVGQHVKAVIVLEGDARGHVSESDIVEYCKDKLAYYKIPRIIDFVGEIPKTDIGKVSRREIRAEGD
jgi:long-chain acyl-CoA synthetase